MSDNILPKHSVFQRRFLNYQGEIHHLGVFVRSGSIDQVQGSMTGTLSMSFDARAVRLRRVQVFHSGAAENFDILVENSAPNTGSFNDPRNIVTCCGNVPGWRNGGTDSTPNQYDAGIDQIEDIVALTDCSSEETAGNLYLKLMPYGTGGNDFVYLLFFEAVFLYANKDGSING